MQPATLSFFLPEPHFPLRVLSALLSCMAVSLQVLCFLTTVSKEDSFPLVGIHQNPWFSSLLQQQSVRTHLLAFLYVSLHKTETSLRTRPPDHPWDLADWPLLFHGLHSACSLSAFACLCFNSYHSVSPVFLDLLQPDRLLFMHRFFFFF